MDGLKFFTRANIHHSEIRISLEHQGQFLRADEDCRVLFMARLDVSQNFFDIQIAIAFADPGQCFLRLKGATAAAPDVIVPEQSALRAGASLKHLTHRGGRTNHAAKNFWISFNTSTKRSIS